MTAMIKNAETGSFEDRTIEVLHDAVVECCGPNGWDLYVNSDAISQQLKALSECGEACDSVNKGDYEQLKDDVGDVLVCMINWCQLMPCDFLACWAEPEKSTHYEPQGIKKDVAELCAHTCYLPYDAEDCESLQIDSLLCCIRQLCLYAKINPIECLGVAYDVISKRKGRIINGTFVKSEDL